MQSSVLQAVINEVCYVGKKTPTKLKVALMT